MSNTQELSTDDIKTIEDRVVYHFNRMEYDEARNWALEGVQINNDVCLYFLGVIAEKVGRFDEAVEWFTRNVNVNNDSDSAAELGAIFFNMDDNPNMPTDRGKAEYYLDYALRLNNKNGMAALSLALCKLANDSTDLNELRRLLNIAYNNSEGETKRTAKKFLDDLNSSEQKQAPPPPQNNGGGCFITTAVCGAFGKPDDCYELTAFRNFRDGWLIEQSDGRALIDEYYAIAPKIVARIDRLKGAAEIYKAVWKNYLSRCLKFIEAGDYERCRKQYVAMVNELRDQFLKEG